MRRFSTNLVVALATLLLVSSSSAQQAATTSVPNLIRYAGTLKDASGAPIAATTGVTFAIYKQQDGGASVWMETQNVAPDASGQYSVLLGSTTATGLPSDLFSQDEQRWLGVQAQGQAEQARVLLVSVPYALKAVEADRLAGHSVSEFVTTDKLQSVVQEQLQQQGGPTTARSTTTNASGKSGKVGIKAPLIAPATDFIDSTSNWVVSAQQNGPGFGAIAYAPNNSAVVGANNNAPPSNIDAGVQAITTKPTGYGLYARQMATGGTLPTAVWGQSDSDNGRGGYFWSNSIASLTGYGVAARADGPNSIAVFAKEMSMTGIPSGLWSEVNSPSARGLYIWNKASGTIDGPLILARTNAGSKFAVDGSGNVNTYLGTYQIGNTDVLSIGKPAGLTDQNVFLGVKAGLNNVGGSVTGNTFVGYEAGFTNTTGGGNTYVGNQAGMTSAPGTGTCCNTFVGNGAGAGRVGPMSGAGNSLFGHRAGEDITTGGKNTFSGYWSGLVNQDGNFNSFYGDQSGQSMTSGDYNTFLGISAAGTNFTTGSNNTFVGAFAGDQENNVNNNIEIGNSGPSYETPGSNQILIGTLGTQTDTYVQGIYNSTAGAGPYQTVCVDSNGKLVGFDPEFGCRFFSSQKQHAVPAPQQDVIKAQQEHIEAQGQQIAELQERLSRLELLITKK